MALLPINTSSYNGFKADALARASQGLGYDVDGYFGYQCWDLVAELWMNIGFAPGLWPKTGPALYAEECWTVSRVQNAGDKFDLIYNFNELKTGDVIVISASPISSTGHIAFCDEDYNGTTTMRLLGQNQVNPSVEYGHIPTLTNLDVSAFLGAFRYHEWASPTPPHVPKKQGRFPWRIYARKLREKRRNTI